MLRIGEMVNSVAVQEIMARFCRLKQHQIQMKTTSFDLVTEADEAAERAIALWLQKSYPKAAILGEEAAARKPELLHNWTDAPLTFVIDPLDGTKNFASGLPLFGVMVAIVEYAQVVVTCPQQPYHSKVASPVQG